MSSDDSGDEDTIVSHSLPWLSAHVVTLKRKLDLEICKITTCPPTNESSYRRNGNHTGTTRHFARMGIEVKKFNLASVFSRTCWCSFLLVSKVIVV